jgi:hypothetical protein
MTFGRVEPDPQAALRDAGSPYEISELVVQTQLRILQVDRVDRVARHRYVDLHRAHEAFLTKSDDARAASAWSPFIHAIKIDEEDRFAGTIRMRHAGAQAAGNEGEVRVGIARLDGALLGIEVFASFQPIVLVACTLRKDRPEGIDVRGHVLRAQSRGKAAIEEAGGGVEGPVKALGKESQRLVFRFEVVAQVDDVEPCSGSKLERQIERFFGHLWSIGGT